MPLNRNKPFGEICGGAGPYGSRYEQNNRYYKVNGDFCGPPNVEDEEWVDETDVPNDLEAIQEMAEELTFVKWLMSADGEALREYAKTELGMKTVGRTTTEKIRTQVYEAKYGN